MSGSVIKVEVLYLRYFLRFETTMRQRQLVSKIKAEFPIFWLMKNLIAGDDGRTTCAGMSQIYAHIYASRRCAMYRE